MKRITENAPILANGSINGAFHSLWREAGVEDKIDVLWGGDVTDASKTDADTEAIRAFNRKLQADERVSLSLIPLGDGLTLACKL